MNVLDHMTLNEATVLAAVLLDGGKDAELMALFSKNWMPSDAAQVIGFAIDDLYEEGKPIDCITVFEQIQDRGDEEHSNMALLTSICQYIQPSAVTLAILRKGLA